MYKYNQIADEKKLTEEEPAQIEEAAEEVVEEVTEKDSGQAKDILEKLAYDFIAGKFGSDLDTAKDRINATGADGSEVISVAIRILNGTYYE